MHGDSMTHTFYVTPDMTSIYQIIKQTASVKLMPSSTLHFLQQPEIKVLLTHCLY